MPSSLARSTLAHALMFFSRGSPVIYYGDEQGFTGDGGDKDARQDMFANAVPPYADDDLIGTDATTPTTTSTARTRCTGRSAVSRGSERATGRCSPERRSTG